MTLPTIIPMKQLFRLLTSAALLLMAVCRPAAAQSGGKYPNFELLTEAEQAAYDKAPAKILPDAKAAFDAAKYDRAIALCNYHYIYYGDKVGEMPGGANELNTKNELDANAKRCYDLTQEMKVLLNKGDLSGAKKKAGELLQINNRDKQALAVLMKEASQRPDTVFVTAPQPQHQPQKPDTVFVTVPQPQKPDTVYVTVPAPEPQPQPKDTVVVAAPVEVNEPDSAEAVSVPAQPQQPEAPSKPAKEEYKPRTTFVVKAGAGMLDNSTTHTFAPQLGLGLYDLGGSRIGFEADAYKCIGNNLFGIDAGLVIRAAKSVYIKAGAGFLSVTEATSTQGLCGMAGLTLRFGKHFLVDAGVRIYPEVKVYSDVSALTIDTVVCRPVAPVISFGIAF